MKKRKVYIPYVWDLRPDADICLVNLTANMGKAFSSFKKAVDWVEDQIQDLDENARRFIYLWPDKDYKGRSLETPGFTLLNGIHYFIFTHIIE